MSRVSFAFLLALFLGLSSPAQASETSSSRFLIHLLDYLAKDYAGAVDANKNVLSKGEYDEQVEFVESAFKMTQEVPELKTDQSIPKKVLELKTMILAKDHPNKVSKLAREIQIQAIEVAKIDLSPRTWPSLARGQDLYVKNCTACHGEKGGGDGPAGVGLDPKPANFLDIAATAPMTPFNSYNVIRLGVPGTGMASYHQLSDDEVWALAFYVNSLRYEPTEAGAILDGLALENPQTLKLVASSTDEKIMAGLKEEGERQGVVAALRTYQVKVKSDSAILFALAKLTEVGEHYKQGRFDQAKEDALQAYLEGVEPVEPQVRASDPALVVEIEERMSAVRSAVENRESDEKVMGSIQLAQEKLKEVAQILQSKEMSPSFAFLAAFAILLREGFEAVLIVLALLGVIRAAGNRRAALWVHGGWLAALGVGVVTWFFSGFLLGMSGASREMLEGMIAIFAVIVLLYVGFWLHRQTEIGRWKNFLEVQVKELLSGRNLFGLALISFMAVFREAFETVLFLRAIWIDGSTSSHAAMLAGVASSLALVFALSWLALTFSKRLPLRTLFTFSSVLMLALATILTGKGVHALQETGAIGVSALPTRFRWELIGFYPTYQTMIAQMIVFLMVLALWYFGTRPSSSSSNVASAARS